MSTVDASKSTTRLSIRLSLQHTRWTLQLPALRSLNVNDKFCAVPLHEGGCRLGLSKILLNAGKEQTQGLDSRSLFRIRDGRVEPGLQPLAVPVRSIVIPLRGGEARERLASAVRDYILPIAAEAGIWLQDPKKYHSTVFHASPHQVCQLEPAFLPCMPVQMLLL